MKANHALAALIDAGPMTRSFAHELRRQRSSRLRNVARGVTAAGEAEARDIILPDCRRRGFRMAAFSPDPTWSEWA